jgi:hypothetical protein
MSQPTGPASTSRPTVVPTLLGLLLVVAVIVVALVIERATDDDGLPDELSGGLRATDLVDPDRFDSGADAERFAVQQGRLRESAEEQLEDVLDLPVTVRSYQTDGSERVVTITTIDEAAGPWAPAGAQPEPALLGMQRAGVELVREGEAVCHLAWGVSVPEGRDVPDDDPASVQCQLGADGRTYWLNGRGVSADDAVDLLESVAD